MSRLKFKRNGFARLAVMLSMLWAVVLLVGCGVRPADAPATEDGAKTFVYGTTGYGPQMDDVGLNPHHAYAGWSAVRYGVGETLFRFNDEMGADPWLATAYENVDETHVRITLRDDVTFSNGRKMDAHAVKECLDDLVATHDRAPGDLKVKEVAVVDDTTVEIETTEPCPALINYLSDPYGAIIDMQAGVTEEGNVVGTGPYVATQVSETEISLSRNDAYWGGQPAVESVVVRSFSDTDALQSALQSNVIDASYGLAYASYPLFAGDDYAVSDCFTSRVFFCQANMASPVMADEAVRAAFARAIDRDSFVRTLLMGRGRPAKGPFPEGTGVQEGAPDVAPYDLAAAARILEDAGWVNGDGDGVREKGGQRLTLRWLTYPGRLELPLLAEAAQATLAAVGFDVQVNSTANHAEVRKDPEAWDVYASALTTAPTGDPEYFFGATCLSTSPKNFGGYRSKVVDELFEDLHTTWDAHERAAIAARLSQQIVDDGAYLFVSHLQMGIVRKANVSGIEPHPCDYYEITAGLDV